MTDPSTLQLGTVSAVADVRRKLWEIGIEDAASILYLAANEAELRRFAPEVLSDCFGNEAWFALLHVWQSSAFQGRRLVESQGVRLAAPPTPPVSTAPAAPTLLDLPSLRVRLLFRWCRRQRPSHVERPLFWSSIRLKLHSLWQ